MRAPQLLGRERSERDGPALRGADEAAHDLVGGPEWHPATNQVVGEVRRQHRGIQGGAHGVGHETGGPERTRHGGQRE